MGLTNGYKPVLAALLLVGSLFLCGRLFLSASLSDRSPFADTKNGITFRAAENSNFANPAATVSATSGDGTACGAVLALYEDDDEGLIMGGDDSSGDDSVPSDVIPSDDDRSSGPDVGPGAEIDVNAMGGDPDTDE